MAAKSKRVKKQSERSVKLPNKITLDNYSDFRTNILRSTSRAMFPKKSELVDRKGNLKVSKETVDALMEAATRVMKEGFAVYRDEKGRFVKKGDRPELALDQVIKEIKKDNTLTEDQKISAIATEITLSTLDETEKRQLQSRLKSSGTIRDQDYYSAKHYIDKGGFDVDEVNGEALEALAEAILTGELTVSDDIKDDILQRTGNVSDEETLTTRTSPSIKKLSAIEGELRRSLRRYT